MKKILILTIALASFAACKKDETTPANTPNNNTPTGCGDGMICFNLNGTDISKTAGGYELADTFLFVKYEEGQKQLSIDIFGKTTGDYPVSEVRKKGNARIYYFNENTKGEKYYMAPSGKLNISAYDATSKKLTGTFSGTLYLYDNATNKFDQTDSVVIKNGSFTTAPVPKI